MKVHYVIKELCINVFIIKGEKGIIVDGQMRIISLLLFSFILMECILSHEHTVLQYLCYIFIYIFFKYELM